jgi:hypothetical protein
MNNFFCCSPGSLQLVFEGVSVDINYDCHEIILNWGKYSRNGKGKIIIKRVDNNCWTVKEKRRVDYDGYYRIRFKQKETRLHKFMFCLFNNIPLKEMKHLVVRHDCDNRACCNPRHLRKGTRLDNYRDMVMRKRAAFQKQKEGKFEPVQEVELPKSLEYLEDIL